MSRVKRLAVLRFWLFKKRLRCLGVWRKKVVIPFWRRFRPCPKDEFDPSLSLDFLAMLEMSYDEREVYLRDLKKRREIAHLRSLGLSPPSE